MRFKEFKLNELEAPKAPTAPAAPTGPLDNFYSKIFSWGKSGDDTAATTDAGGDSGSGLTNFKSSGSQIDPNEIKSYLKSKGFDNNQAAGWLVNIKWECNFKPGAYVASDAGQGQSGGLFGFHDVKNGKGLFTDMVKFTGGGNKWQTNWQGQLDYAMQDSRGQQYKSLKFTSPGQAAHWWTVNYEKPANTMKQAQLRAASASKYA
jgi:hypothetical protein